MQRCAEHLSSGVSLCCGGGKWSCGQMKYSHMQGTQTIIYTGLSVTQHVTQAWPEWHVPLVAVIGSGMNTRHNWIQLKWISGFLRKLPNVFQVFPWTWTLWGKKAASATFIQWDLSLAGVMQGPADICWALKPAWPATNQTWNFQFHAALHSLCWNLKPPS